MGELEKPDGPSTYKVVLELQTGVLSTKRVWGVMSRGLGQHPRVVMDMEVCSESRFRLVVVARIVMRINMFQGRRRRRIAVKGNAADSTAVFGHYCLLLCWPALG